MLLACSIEAIARELECAQHTGSDLQRVWALSKSFTGVGLEPLYLMRTVLELLGVSVDIYKYPDNRRPLDLSAEELRQIDLFKLCILQSMLDREGSTKHGLVKPLPSLNECLSVCLPFRLVCSNHFHKNGQLGSGGSAFWH